MPETKKYVSIPTIDNCNLPASLIRKCKETYRKYGKYKLYDIINADLNSRVKYSHEEREKFKKLELTKRYLYLYRRAMAETMGFVYNDDNQISLVDEEIKEFDDTNICPYCGKPLQKLSQIGSMKGFPKSHYNDVWKKYTHLVLFNKYPEKHKITVSLKSFLDNIDLPVQVGYEFVYWSVDMEKPTDITTERVLIDNITEVLTDETYSLLTEEDKRTKIKIRSDLSILNFINMDEESDDYGKLVINAVYKSNTDNVLMPVSKRYEVNLSDIYNIYSNDMKVSEYSSSYKEAFDFLNHKGEYYEFGYFAIDDDIDNLYVPEENTNTDISVKEYLNPNSHLSSKEISLNVVSVFSAKRDIENANYINFGKNIRQLAVEVLTEPFLVDNIYKTDNNGNVTSEEVGKYTFFQWSMDDEASIFILEDERSLQPLHEIETIIENNSIDLYALFKYDVPADTIAYDDDCYISVYRQYKGIDKAYSKKIFNEYHSTIETGDKTNLTEKQYSLLSPEEQSKYTLQKSFVTYRGYPNIAGVAGVSYTKDGKLRVIKCKSDLTSDTYKRYQCYSHVNGEPTGVFLSYSTPGVFEIWYNLNKELWFRYESDYDNIKDKFKTKWLNTTDLNDEPRDEEPSDNDGNWIKYVCSKKIGIAEYLSLSDENKLNCEINKIYYDYEWEVIEGQYIQELFNCNTIKEYNNKIGTKDGSFGVDTNSFADITNETYRLYQYHINHDANIDMSKIDLGKDDDIVLTTSLTTVNDSGNYWLYPINENNRLSFLTLIQGATPENGLKNLYYRNGKYLFFKDDIIDNDLEYTRLRPIDSTGNNKLNYTLENLWKCTEFENGDILIYRNHEWLKKDNGDLNVDTPNMILNNASITLQEIAYKYGVSTSFTINNDINNTTGEYELIYDTIVLDGPGIGEIQYYDSQDQEVIIPNTIVKIYYAETKKYKNALSLQKEYIRRTDQNGLFEQTVSGRGTKLYVYLKVGETVTDDKYLSLSSKTETVQSVDSNGQSVFTQVKIYPELEGRNEIETWIYWSDLVDIICEPGIVQTENGPVTIYDKLKSPENNPVLYRLESDAEFNERQGEVVGKNNNLENKVINNNTFRYYGKSVDNDELIVWRSEDRIDFYTSWYAQADVNFTNSKGQKIISISGGYPDNGKFVPLTETVSSLRTLRSVSYSEDATAVSGNGSSTTQTEEEQISEQDTNVWWNQYGKFLTGNEKNNYIINTGINFSGWVWTGWDTIVFKDNGKDQSIDVDNCVMGNGGLIEAYPFNDVDNYISMGFQRILYPKEYNKTYSTTKSDEAIDGKYKLTNIVDSITREPIRLLRYCSNQECELFKKRLDKSKWSFQNDGSYFLLNTSENQAHPGLSLDESTPNINVDGSLPSKDKYKNDISSNKFLNSEFDALNTESAFSMKNKSVLQSANILLDSNSSETYTLQGFSLDNYPWHYKNRKGEDDDRDINTHDGKIIKYLMHTAGSGVPDDLRFEFEYKYATNEFSINKMSSYTSEYNSYKLKEQLDAIKQISHDKTIVPIRDRPIPEFYERYKEVLFNTFENTLIRLNNSVSPYSLFNKEELLIMNSILTDLFTYNKDKPDSLEFIDFKLEIVSLMNDMIDYEYYRRNYWDEKSSNSEYLLNKEIFNTILDRYEHKNEIINDNGEIISDETTFNDFFKNEIKYKTIKLDDNNKNVYDGRYIKRMIVKRTYHALSNTSLAQIIQSYGEIPTYSNNESDRFVGWAKDSVGLEFWNLSSNEANYPVNKNQSIDLYLVYDFETVKLDNNFLNLLETFETDNTVFLKFELDEEIKTIWYEGKDNVKERLKNTLSDLHEKIALPTEFMCCLFNFISSSKLYNIYTDNKGNISSLFVPAGLISSSEKDIKLSISRKSDDDVEYSGAIITKPWKLAKDNISGHNIKEQYYILYNDSGVKAYSFFNNGWLTDIYGEELAKKKFPLMKFSENPIKYIFPEAKLLKIIPVSTPEHESVLIMVYDKGIGLVDVSTGWLTDNQNVISCYKLFGDSDLDIIDCTLNNFNNDKSSLIILSSNDKIASYDITNDVIIPSNSTDKNAALLLDTNTTVVTSNALANLIQSNKIVSSRTTTSTPEGVLDRHVGLTIKLKDLIPSDYSGDPWILNSDVDQSFRLPESLSDSQYSGMSDIDKEKYHIHPKLTVRYAMNTQHGFDAEHDEVMDWTYKSLYIDNFDQNTEGEFEIVYNGEVISKSDYFNILTDDSRKKCKIYKLETINYTFVRLTFSNRTGTGIYDSELDKRMTGNVPLYAFYYKTGEEVDEFYGYKIIKTENIVNGEDSLYSDVFDDYIKENDSSDNDFVSSIIDGWTTNNLSSQYKNNIVEDLPLLTNIKRIFPISGYKETNSDRYVYLYIISNDVKSQLIQYYNNTLYVVGEYDYKDNNKLVMVRSFYKENKVYLIYENQRVIVLQTYEYVPSEFSIALNNKIKLFASTDNPETENSVSYLTDDNRIINMIFDTNNYTDSSAIIKGKELSKFFGDKSVNIISLINTNIKQTDDFKHIPNYRCWINYEGNDKTKYQLSQIN